MILGIYERWKNRTISFGLYAAIFLACGPAAASFQMWRHEHAARIVAEQTPKGRNPATVKQLQDFYADASSYYDAVLEAKTDKEYQDLEKLLDKWADKLSQWMLLNMGTGASARLTNATQPAPTFKNMKPERSETLKALAVIRDNLAKFVESPAWDKP